MEERKRFKPDDAKIFIVPFLIITIAFFIVGYVTITTIQNYYYDRIQNDSLKLAKIYSYSLTVGTEAYDVINELLEEKILTASQTAAAIQSPSNDLLRAMAENLNIDELDYYSPEGEIIYSNLPEMLGWHAVPSHPVYRFLHGSEISLIEDIRRDWVTGNFFKYGYFRTPDGGLVQIGIRADKVHGFLGSFEMQQLLDKLRNISPDSQICFIDHEFNVIGSTNQELIGQTIAEPEILAAINSGAEYSREQIYDGEAYYEVFIPVYFGEAKIGTLAVSQPQRDTAALIKRFTIACIATLIISYISLLYTMIAVNKKNSQLTRLAFYDSVTGLPNKHHLADFLNKEMEKNEDVNKALLLINCLKFRTINLTFGYEYGDEFLREVSRKFSGLLDSNKKLFRFTADRFALYVKDYKDRHELLSIVHKINTIFNSPFIIKNTEQSLGVQVGIVEINEQKDKQKEDFDHILKSVSISLNSLNPNSQANYAFYNREMESRLRRENLLEKEIRAALAQKASHKLYVEYQPQYCLRTNRIWGFEALARLKSSQFGQVSPLEFIALAEKSNLMVALGNYVLSSACCFAARLNKLGFKNIKIAVNVSGVELLQDDFSDVVIETIKQTGVDQGSLELEITESVMLQKFALINEKLKKLQQSGIDIAIDDFGTGYSSLYRFDELNIDTLKIDKSFIDKISHKKPEKIITGDIISIAHKYGIDIVAEGVESPAQKEYLAKNDCDRIQGYLISKPLSEEEAIKLLMKLSPGRQ